MTANKKRFTIFCQSKLSLEIYLHPSSWKSRWLTSATCVSLVFVVFSSRPSVAPPQRAPSRDPSLSSLIFVARVVDLIATFVFYGAWSLLISLHSRPSSASFHPTQGPSDDHPFTIDVMGEMFEAEKLRGDALRHSADKAVNADYVAEVQTKGMLVRHRRILVEWMMEFSDAFKLNPEVLPLAVNFFDRFLSIHDLEKKKLHLLCMVVLFVASKTAEVHHIMMNELVDATGRVYTSQDVRDLEKDLLSKLDWQMQPVTAYQVRTHTH